MGSMPDVHQISVSDGETSEEILALTDTDDLFDEITEPPNLFADLSWTDRKLIQGDPVYEIDYFLDNEVGFTISVYQIETDDLARLPKDQQTEIRTISYNYTPSDDQASYIFALKEGNLIYAATDGMKQLINVLQ